MKSAFSRTILPYIVTRFCAIFFYFWVHFKPVHWFKTILTSFWNPLPICKLKSKEKSSDCRLRKNVWYPPLVLSILILGSFFRTIPSEAIWTDLSSGCGSNQPFFPFSPKSWAMGNLSLCIANGKHISGGFPKEIVFARSYWNQSFKLDKFEYISDLFTLSNRQRNRWICLDHCPWVSSHRAAKLFDWFSVSISGNLGRMKIELGAFVSISFVLSLIIVFCIWTDRG